MKNLHRITGIIVSVFIVAHLFNHLMAWFGIATHQAIMDTFRIVYQNPIIETLLVGAFLFQSVSGIVLFLKLRKKEDKTAADKLKMYAGLVLGLFIINHIGATIGQRLYYQFDTNFYFAARVVLQKPFLYFFAPYYFFGILSFGVHIACVHREKIAPSIGIQKANFHFKIIISFFIILALLILFVFMGGLYEIEIPAPYNVY